MADSPYKLLAVFYDRLFEAHRGWLDRAWRQILGGILTHAPATCDTAAGRPGMPATEML